MYINSMFIRVGKNTTTIFIFTFSLNTSPLKHTIKEDRVPHDFENEGVKAPAG